MERMDRPVILVVAPNTTAQLGLTPTGFLGRMPNIGILYLAAALEASGYQAIAIDHQHDATSPLDLAAEINALRPSLVGFTLYDITAETTRRTLTILRMVYKGPIVVGGYTPTFHAEDILRAWPEVDYVVLREGEEAIVALMEHLAGLRTIATVPNLVYRDGDAIRFNPENTLVDVTTLPWPKRIWPEQGDVTPLITRRGCMSRCNFCSMVPFYDVRLGPKVRWRKPTDVADEIAYCVSKGSGEFMFYDDDFGLSSKVEHEWCREFIQEVRRRELLFHWGIELRVTDVIRGADILRELCEIGLTHISIGMESLLPRQLKVYGKGYKQEDVLKAIAVAQGLPLDHQTNVLFWDPWITLQEAAEHVELLDQIQIQEQLGSANFPFFANVLNPRRGTQIHALLTEENRLQLRPGSFCDYVYDFVDPDVAWFHRGAHREFLGRVRAVARPDALWLLVPRLEKAGFVELGKQYRAYARAIAHAEFEYFRTLITAVCALQDRRKFEHVAQAIHAEHAPRVDACALLLPDVPSEVLEHVGICHPVIGDA